MVSKTYLKLSISFLLIILLSINAFAVWELSHGLGQTTGELWGSPEFDETFNVNDFTVGNDHPLEICDLNRNGEFSIFTYTGSIVREYQLQNDIVVLADSYNTGATVTGLACLDSGTEFEHRLFVWTTESVFVIDKTSVSANFSNVGTLIADYNGATINATTTPFCRLGAGFNINYYGCTIGTNQGFWIFDTQASDFFNGGVFVNTTNSGYAPNGFQVFYNRFEKVAYFRDASTFIILDLYDFDESSAEYNATTKTLTPLNNDYDVISYFSEVAYRNIEDMRYSQSFGDDYMCIYRAVQGLYTGETGFAINLICYSGTSELFNKNIYSGSIGGASPIYSISGGKIRFYPLQQTPRDDVCISYNLPSGTSGLRCYEMTTGNSILEVSENSLNDIYQLETIGNIFELDKPQLIYRRGNIRYSTTYAHNITTSNQFSSVVPIDLGIPENFNHFIFFKDINRNDRQELIATRSGYTAVIFSVDIEPYEILVNPNIDYEGLYGFYNPACVDEELTIYAKECYTNTSQCTYFNTDPNRQFRRQRLIGDCEGVEVVGAWSFSNPVWKCTPNNTGNLNIDLILESEPFIGSTAYNFKPFNVAVSDSNCGVNYVELQDPNIGGIPDNGGTTPPPTNGDEESTLYKFFSYLPILIALLISIVLVVSLAVAGVYSPFLLTALFVVSLVFFAIIGWFPVGYLILITALLTLLAIIMIILGRRGE